MTICDHTSRPVMTILALDSATTTGWAFVTMGWEGEDLGRYGAWDVHSAADVDDAAGSLANFRPSLVVIEEPFVSPRNPATGLSLARLLGRWLQAFEMRGVATTTVPASMWQTSVLPGVTQWTRSAERKAAAVAFAWETYGVRVGEDIADAIAMGTWVVRNATRRAA